VLTLKLVRLIEKHSEELVGGLTEQIHLSERTSDFRKIPAAELELAAAEVYRNLGEWLLQKTDKDIETRFRAIGARRAAEGIGLHQFVWVITCGTSFNGKPLPAMSWNSTENSNCTKC
jgi:hypothetical protein